MPYRSYKINFLRVRGTAAVKQSGASVPVLEVRGSNLGLGSKILFQFSALKLYDTLAFISRSGLFQLAVNMQ